MIANSAIATARNNVAPQHNNLIWAVPDLTGILGDDPMRTFEALASSVLAFAAQALVVGLVITTF